MEGVGGWKVLRRMVVGGSERESTQKEGELLYIPKAEWMMEWPGPPSPLDAVWSKGTGSRAKSYLASSGLVSYLRSSALGREDMLQVDISSGSPSG